MPNERHYSNFIVYIFLLINSFFILLLYSAYLLGWIAKVFESDSSFLTYVIAVIFFLVWLLSLFIGVKLNSEFKYIAINENKGESFFYFELLKRKFKNGKSSSFDQSILASSLRAKLHLRIRFISYVANLLILLGLIGTVLGFIIAVGGLGDSLSGGQNLTRVQTVLGQIVNGMGVALFTTLLGSIFGGIWLQLHYEILSSSVERLVINIVEEAEVNLIPNLTKSVK